MEINDFSYFAYKNVHEELDSTQAFKSYLLDKGRVDYAASLINNSITENTNRIVSSVDSAASKISDAVNTAANQVSKSIEQAAIAICGRLDNIDTKLDFLNRKADIIIEQNNLTNMLLGDIAELLRIPDSEKERQHEIALGIKYFVNASNDTDLFEDALEHFLKAESIQKQDYFVLHRIGIIYLFVGKVLDPNKAYDYFTRAAKYSKSESDPNSVRLANVLISKANSTYASLMTQTDKIKMLAADSFEKAAFAAYVIGDIEAAITNQQSAYEYCNTGENQFYLSKYLAHNGNIEDSLNNLDAAIEKVPSLAAAVFQEKDMVERPDIIELVNRKNNDVMAKLSEMYQNAQSESVKNYIQTAIDGSYAAKRTVYRRLSKMMR